MKYVVLLSEWYHRLDLRDRIRIGTAIAITLLLLIILSAANDRIGRMKKRLTAREAELAEMMVLKARHAGARAMSQRLSNRLAATRPDDSPARIIEEIGIRGKGIQIRPIRGEEREGFVEDSAEVKIEGVTANELVNLVFRLENGNRPVIVRKTLIKSRFDDPSRLDVAMAVSLLRPSAGGER